MAKKKMATEEFYSELLYFHNVLKSAGFYSENTTTV